MARSCYERLLVGTPAAHGKMLVSMRIGADGTVARVTLTKNEVGEEKFSQCVKSKLMTNYPRGPEGGCADVNVPLKFEPKKNDGSTTP